MATSTYNPYNAYKKIVSAKGDWHTAKQLGQDPKQYYEAAIPYYQELAQNGYETLADELSRSDYTTSKSLRDKYGLKPDEEQKIDDYMNAMEGNAQENGTPDFMNATHANDTSIDKLLDQVSGENSMTQKAFDTAQGIAAGSTPVRPSAATQGLLDAYNDENNRLNGEIRYDENGNVVGGLNTSHYNTGKQQLDYYNNFDVTKAPYYEGIMAAYQLGGQNAANNAYANGAANNSGNIDSYAAANANRQQLAYTTAGQQAALAAAQQNAENWNNLYAQMSDDLYKQGALSLETLDIAKQMYAKDADERMNALDVQGSLASQQMASAVQQFQTLVQERMNDKGITAEMAMQDKDIQAAKEQLEMQLASNEKIQEGINALGYYQTDANERMNTENNATQRYGYDTQRYGYDTQLEGVRDTNAANRDVAGINANATLGVAGINRDATLGAANINANASMTNAERQAAMQEYLGKLGYDQTMAGYQNALDQITAQGKVSSDLAALEQQYQKEYLDYLTQNGLTLDSKGNVVSSGSVDANGNSVDSQLADVYQTTSKLVQMYKQHQDASLASPEDVYAAAMEYDTEHYGGAHQKEIYTYINNFLKLGKNTSGTSDLLAQLLGGIE